MKCFYCKSDMTRGVTTHVAELKNCIVIIKNVPSMKCEQCWEVTPSGDVVRKIKQVLEHCESAITEVAIVNHKDTAA